MKITCAKIAGGPPGAKTVTYIWRSRGRDCNVVYATSRLPSLVPLCCTRQLILRLLVTRVHKWLTLACNYHDVCVHQRNCTVKPDTRLPWVGFVKLWKLIMTQVCWLVVLTTEWVTMVMESLQMHFKVAVRNFHALNLTKWGNHRCYEGFQCIVVERWTAWAAALGLPCAISLRYHWKQTTVSPVCLQPG